MGLILLALIVAVSAFEGVDFKDIGFIISADLTVDEGL